MPSAAGFGMPSFFARSCILAFMPCEIEKEQQQREEGT